jgi:hypothetical protein
MLLDSRIIANSLTEQCGNETFQISGFWADDGQTGSYPELPESPVLTKFAGPAGSTG